MDKKLSAEQIDSVVIKVTITRVTHPELLEMLSNTKLYFRSRKLVQLAQIGFGVTNGNNFSPTPLPESITTRSDITTSSNVADKSVILPRISAPFDTPTGNEDDIWAEALDSISSFSTT